MRQNVLLGALAAVALIVVGFYALRWFGGSTALSPDQLAATALDGGSLEQRESAAVALIDVGPAGAANLRRLLGESRDDQVRAAAIEGLGKNADFESMDVLLAALDDDSATVRGRAGYVVGRMLGRDRRFRADAPLEERQRISKHYREDWKFLQNSPHFDEYRARFHTP